MIPNSLSLDLQDAYNFLQFWINKNQSGWYSPEDLDMLVDKGQLTYYKDCFIKYGTGQRLNDALAPFKKKLPFTTDSTGFLSVPNDYMDLITIGPAVGGITMECPVLNDDELTGRKKSQVIPNTISAPFAEEIENWNYQLYPQVLQSGIITYFSRPPAPKFVYTTVSGRVIVYDKTASTQLLWGDDEVQSVLIAALRSIGINIGEQDIQQFANQINAENLMSTMKI